MNKEKAIKYMRTKFNEGTRSYMKPLRNPQSRRLGLKESE